MRFQPSLNKKAEQHGMTRGRDGYGVFCIALGLGLTLSAYN